MGMTPPADRRGGGALHLSAVLPALSAAIGHPTPTKVHADPKACQRALGLPDAESAIVVLVDGLGYWNLAMRLGHAPLSAFADERKRQSASHRYLRSKHHCGGHGRIRYRNLPGTDRNGGLYAARTRQP